MGFVTRCINKAIAVYTTEQSRKRDRDTETDFFKQNPDAKVILKNNAEFEQAYKGKRCFVLGNGPSLKDVNFSILYDEYTFTVNQIARMKDFPELHTNFHFWADPAFFNIDPRKPEDLELLEVMKSVDTEDNHPFVFLPYEHMQFVKKWELEKSLKIFYYKSRGMEVLREIDYTTFVPAFHTVVHWCITMAIYMGFSEIYLLGCDNTSLINQIESAAGTAGFMYGYEVTENEKKRMGALLNRQPLRNYVYSYLRVLDDYERLYDYCNEKGIKLVNCTEHSAIDCIPKSKLSTVLCEPT